MNWKEFKEKVESEGVTDDMKIWWIDMDGRKEFNVDIEDKFSGIIITNK